MQSSALHLPRCIDAIYESPAVLSAKTHNLLYHQQAGPPIIKTGAGLGGGLGNWQNSRRLRITALAAEPGWKRVLSFLSLTQSALGKRSPHTPASAFHFFIFFTKLNSASLNASHRKLKK